MMNNYSKKKCSLGYIEKILNYYKESTFLYASISYEKQYYVKWLYKI